MIAGVEEGWAQILTIETGLPIDHENYRILPSLSIYDARCPAPARCLMNRASCGLDRANFIDLLAVFFDGYRYESSWSAHRDVRHRCGARVGRPNSHLCGIWASCGEPCGPLSSRSG